MPKENFNKYLCFSKDLTLATRLIAFVGIAISVLLITVLLNDSFARDFEMSRKIALALGLDWRHIHSYTNTSKHADPEGKVISAVLIFYSTLFFLTNVALLFAAVAESPSFAIPWLTCELFGCASKLIALIFHVATELDNLSNLFITGSVVYIAVAVWWWIVVYVAQSGWPKNERDTLELSTLPKNQTAVEISSILFESPRSYTANQLYSRI